MNFENNLYTGTVKYKEIQFQFVLFNNELRLIPPSTEQEKIKYWFLKEISDGKFTFYFPKIGTDHLIGNCNETGQKILFLMEQEDYIARRNTVLVLELTAYIKFKYDCESIGRISFQGPEINCIYPIQNASEIELDTTQLQEFVEKGSVQIKIKDFESTTTKKQIFMLDNKEVNVYFSIRRGIGRKDDDSPIILNSTLILQFESTSDVSFLFDLYKITRLFVQYLCNRRNINFDLIELGSLQESGKYANVATLCVFEHKDESIKERKNEKYIRYECIKGHEGAILSAIASHQLYLRHLPNSFKSDHEMDAGDFVIITAAFEWEFKKIYPNGIPKSDQQIKAEQEAKNALENLRKNSTSRLKNIYKHLEKLIGNDPLKNEIERIGTDYDDIIGKMGERLYLKNKENFCYSEIGDRLATQRNNFAHGNLDKNFIGLSLLDLVFLKRIIYVMQLDSCGVERKQIAKAITELFGV